jgi:phosphoglycolate phosphatase-like HAD superfamily hydrolase/ADP-ribose pyrophosphatase YjhB (NUDIX family)
VIRNIIFDWSGTLVDDLPAVWSATNDALEKGGVSGMSLERFRAEFCLPFPLFYERVIPQVPLEKVEEWFHAAFRQAQHLVVDLPHARDFLVFCREHSVRMFVLSTIHEEYYRVHTAANGFGQFIERPYLAVRDKRQVIHTLLEENGLKAGETLFIGDMQHDMDTARHGGVFSCGVLTGYNHLDQLRASHPDLIVEHLGELKSILESRGFDLSATAESSVKNPQYPISTVGAAIFDDAGRVLMVRTRKWSDLWGIPGGKIKWGETSENALRREILEETDLQIDDIRFVLVQDCIQSNEFYRDAHFVLLNYTCRTHGAPSVKLNDEAREFRWVTVSEALGMALNTPTRILLKALSKEP